MGELLHLCHEAAERRSERTGACGRLFVDRTHILPCMPDCACVDEQCDVLQELSTEFSTSTPKQSA